MKMEFEFDAMLSHHVGHRKGTGIAIARIIGKEPDNKPYVAIVLRNDINTLADVY